MTSVTWPTQPQQPQQRGSVSLGVAHNFGSVGRSDGRCGGLKEEEGGVETGDHTQERRGRERGSLAHTWKTTTATETETTTFMR